MNDGKYLSEENYQKIKKKLLRISLVILIIGSLIGFSLIGIGLIKTNEIKKQNEQVVHQIEQSYQARTVEEIQSDIDTIQNQIDILKTEISNLEIEQSKIFRDDGFSDSYYDKDLEIKSKKSEKAKLQDKLDSYEDELWKVQSGYNNTEIKLKISQNTISTAKYVPLYVIGGFIIIASCVIAFSIYMFAKRREISAFTVQQVMSIAQEGIDKMTPTIANAKGTIAKNISKGIKEGLNNDDK